MIKVFFTECEDRTLVPLVHLLKDHSQYNKNVHYIKEALNLITETFVQRVDSVEEADFILFPHHYTHMVNMKEKRDAYIDSVLALSKKYNKKIIIFLYGDKVLDIPWPNAVIFRSSAYKSTLQPNEFILPAIVEDLSFGVDVEIKKVSEKISVGFVGWAGFNSWKRKVKAYIKEFRSLLLGIFKRGLYEAQHRQGVFLRRELLSIIEKDVRVENNSIVRSQYGGFTRDFSEETITQQRQEYIDNITQTHVTLSPRGDGNFSQRFYEVLSLGRFPVLIDTDVALPLEDVIPYDRFVIKVPYKDKQKIVDYIVDFFKGMSNSEYQKRQEEAQFYFRKYLSVNAYYRFLFTEERINDLLCD